MKCKVDTVVIRYLRKNQNLTIVGQNLTGMTSVQYQKFKIQTNLPKTVILRLNLWIKVRKIPAGGGDGGTTVW